MLFVAKTFDNLKLRHDVMCVILVLFVQTLVLYSAQNVNLTF